MYCLMIANVSQESYWHDFAWFCAKFFTITVISLYVLYLIHRRRSKTLATKRLLNSDSVKIHIEEELPCRLSDLFGHVKTVGLSEQSSITGVKQLLTNLQKNAQNKEETSIRVPGFKAEVWYQPKSCVALLSSYRSYKWDRFVYRYDHEEGTGYWYQSSWFSMSLLRCWCRILGFWRKVVVYGKCPYILKLHLNGRLKAMVSKRTIHPNKYYRKIENV